MKKKGRPRYIVGPVEKRTYNGVVYMSILEMNYRKYLDSISEQIESIEEQVPIKIVVNGIKICTYKLDFKVTYKDGRVEYVDPKGAVTATYRLKKKLTEALYPFKIKEVFAGDF